jgi:hypothetical protein
VTAQNAKADIGGPFLSVADLISFKLAQLRQAALDPERSDEFSESRRSDPKASL